ncbi:sensor histidine kinase [Marinoscillum furvescens]|uniref:histidine kinase n=1 Tax=Marinoscillum furvescens DSM 4134 TaxID=1122208 RepID=A0A3D9L2A6_MARFU|nr:HAMP domain-containing sensor histidine kinase [Marinoscillum furvescens]RED96642.1 signal transduction histidine kinase [Marinoscillum furvescens DSM 4134]
MKFFSPGQRLQTIFLAAIILFGTFYLPFVLDYMEEAQREKAAIAQTKVHQEAVRSFQNSVDQFAMFMSGIRSYMVNSETMPSQDDLQSFVEYQLKDLNYSDSLILTYVDTAHIFRYSFSRTQTDPGNLIGTSVRDIRDQDEIARLDAVMQDEEFHLFTPINLVEGMIGVPLNFNIVRHGQSVGYIAAIVDFKTLINPIYENPLVKNYVFRFAVNDSTDFDREQIHDGSRVFHSRKDSQYYGHLGMASSEFAYEELTLYGMNFKIGIAPSANMPSGIPYISWLLYGWYVLLVLFVVVSILRLVKFVKLNSVLATTNRQVANQKEELEKQNKQLEKLVGMKDKLFSIIGHDLRGPLSSILTIMSLVESNKISQEETRQFLKALNDAARSNLSLLDNLLKWSMMNTEVDSLNKSDFEFSRLVNECQLLLLPTAAKKGVKFEVDVPEDLQVQADYDMLGTVIRNLMSNAVKFSHEGGEVKLTAWQKGTHFYMKVEDEGVGMPEDVQNKLFDLGKDSVRNGTNNEKGTGLGLYVSNEFVEAHNGNVFVESEQGAGTSFLVVLPVPGAFTESVLDQPMELRVA